MKPSIVPEYLVEQSEETVLMANRHNCLIQELSDMAVDLAVLYKELTRLEGFSGRIADDCKALELSLRDMV